GITIELTPGQAGTLNMLQASDLKFKIKANTESAHNEFVVRIEDADGGEEYNNTAFVIPPLTTEYQDITVPLSFFQGGGQPADLSIAKNITFGAVNLPFAPEVIEVDFTVDDVIVTGSGTEPIPPITNFLVNFNSQSNVGPTGGVIGTDWGYGNPFFTGSAPTSFVERAPGDYAWEINGDLTNEGDGYSFVAFYVRMAEAVNVGRDVSSATHVRMDARIGADDNLNWMVRLEDSVGDPGLEYQNDHWAFDLPLPTALRTYMIPIEEFTDGIGVTGFVATDLTKVRSITVFTDAGPNSQTAVLKPRLTLDNVGFVFPITSTPGDANDDVVINVADVTAVYNYLNG